MRSDLIRIDGGTQPRAKVDEAVVAEYAEAIRAGAKLPELVVFSDGADHWLADGFHRYHAFRAAGIDEIPVFIRNGTRREAVLFSVGANANHGLRRTNEDKRKAVETLLADPEWAAWSDREIAKACNVTHPFVGSVRSSLETVSSEKPSLDSVSSEKPAGRTYKTKHGTTAQMDTGGLAESNKSRARPADLPPPVEDDGVEESDVVEALREENARLTAENATLRLAAGVDKIKTVENLKAFLATVESQRNDLMDQCNALKREIKQLRRRLGD